MKVFISILIFISLSMKARAKDFTYYYYPKYESYYCVETKTWFYHQGCAWTASKSAPKEMPFFFIKKNHRVLLSYTGPNPLVHHIVFRKKYPKEPEHKVAVKFRSSWKSSSKKNASRVTIYNSGKTINN